MALKRPLVFIILIALISSEMPGSPFSGLKSPLGGAGGEDIIVDPAGNGNYTSIQAAIDNASAGDTIHVWAGTYYENITINKTLSIIGNGSSTTVIDDFRRGDVVVILADHVNFTGFNVTNSSYDYHKTGILLAADNVRIYDNVFYDNLHAINIPGTASDIYIGNNTFVSQKWESVYALGWGTNFTASNNTFINNSAGIIVHGLGYDGAITLDNNTFIGNTYGIRVTYLTEGVIVNNRCENDRIGIDLFDCQGVKLRGNELTGCSLFVFGNDIGGWDSHDIDDSNTVNGKPIRYLARVNDRVVDGGAGEVILASCNNVTVENQELGDGAFGITVGHSSDITLRNNEIVDTYHSTFNSSWYAGIKLWRTSSSHVLRNDLLENDNGIYLEESNDNIIEKNKCNDNGNGIFMMRSGSNIIFNNLFENNSKNGVVIGGAMSPELNNQMMENLLVNNTLNGLLIGNAEGTEVYHNNFIGNPVEVEGEVDSTVWHKDCEGNYWSDYGGKDTGDNDRIKGDHIGDTKIPYNDTDPYPYIRIWGWEYPYTPVLSAPTYDYDGNYTLTWTNLNKSERFEVEEDTDPAFGEPVVVYDGWEIGWEISEDLYDREPGVYFYRARGLNEDFEGDWSEAVNVTVFPYPGVPQGLSAAPYPRGNAVNLTWDPNEDDTVAYDLQYRNWSSWVDLGGVSSSHTTFNHTGLVDGMTYAYRIRSVDLKGEPSKFCPKVEAVPADTIAPSVPTDPFTRVINTSTITVSWDGSPEDDVAGYHVYRGTAADGDFEKISSEAVPSVSFLDSGLNDNSTYYYRISAVDEVPNESDLSEPTSGTTERGKHVYVNSTAIREVEIEEDVYDDGSLNLLSVFSNIWDEPLTFEVAGEEHLRAVVYNSNGTVALIPEKDWSGEEVMRFTASDGIFSSVWRINITVTPVNDPPGPVTIEYPRAGDWFEEGDKIQLRGYCEDPDLNYGDRLTFTWSSNISGELGNKATLERVSLPPGAHLLELIVTDREGESARAGVEIRVEAEYERVEDGGDGGDDGNLTGGREDEKQGDDEGLLLLIIPVIAIVVLALSVIIWALRRKKVEEKVLKTALETEIVPDSPSASSIPGDGRGKDVDLAQGTPTPEGLPDTGGDGDELLLLPKGEVEEGGGEAASKSPDDGPIESDEPPVMDGGEKQAGTEITSVKEGGDDSDSGGSESDDEEKLGGPENEITAGTGMDGEKTEDVGVEKSGDSL